MKFCDRFSEAEQKMFKVLPQLKVSDVWKKVVVALTCSDVIDTEECRDYDVGQLNSWFGGIYDDWKTAIRQCIEDRGVGVGVVKKIPIIPTTSVALNPKHGKLHNEAWLNQLIYKVAVTGRAAPEVVLVLAYAIKPKRFLSMMAHVLGYKMDVADKEHLERLTSGGEIAETHSSGGKLAWFIEGAKAGAKIGGAMGTPTGHKAVGMGGGSGWWSEWCHIIWCSILLLLNSLKNENTLLHRIPYTYLITIM